jgi:hypothetical protein
MFRIFVIKQLLGFMYAIKHARRFVILLDEATKLYLIRGRVFELYDRIVVLITPRQKPLIII